MCPIRQDTMVYSQRKKPEYLTQEDEGLSVGYIVHPGWKSNPPTKDFVHLEPVFGDGHACANE